MKGHRLCGSHLKQRRMGIPLRPVVRNQNSSPVCTIDGCEYPSVAANLCMAHNGEKYKGHRVDTRRVSNEGKTCRFCDAPAERLEACMKHYHQERRYGHMHVDGFQAILNACTGACDVCGASGVELVIDHDHDLETFRGWLCKGCNTAEGLLASDPDRILALAAYVTEKRRHSLTGESLVC